MGIYKGKCGVKSFINNENCEIVKFYCPKCEKAHEFDKE